jgi:hypothetical protein
MGSRGHIILAGLSGVTRELCDRDGEGDMFIVREFALKLGMQWLGLPVGAEVMAMGERDGGLVAWVQVPRDMPTSQAVLERSFLVLRTGEDCDFKIAASKYHGSVLTFEGFVYHLFEVTPGVGAGR